MSDHTPVDPDLASITLQLAGRPGGIALHPPATSAGPARRLSSEAMRWTHVLRAKERWLDQSGAREARAEDARQTLLAFGLTDKDLQAIGQAHRVVVRMPYRTEAQGWAGRIFPWEYVIAVATRRWRPSADHHLTVMREFTRPRRAHSRAERAGARRMLFVQSAPGALADGWGFADEQRRMQAALAGIEFHVLKNPSLHQLEAQVLALRPDLIHLSGFDNLQGLRALRELVAPSTPVELSDGESNQTHVRSLADLLADERGVRDGLLMRADTGRARLAQAQELALALSAHGQHCAYFIGVSAENSAARTAALLVAQGVALAAVGFQDKLDESWAEFFFELLYTPLAREAWHLPRAFEQAWLRARQEPNATRATGVVLWTGAPVLAAREPADRVLQPLELPKSGLPPHLMVEPFTELNYAVLHNGEPLFKQFIVERGQAGPGDWLSVDVELQLGTETARYSKRFLADKSRFDLAREIHLPLTAGLMRSSHEAINSSLVIQLTHGSTVLERTSHRMRLLPVDQWRDNASDGQWLPSFVLPRDPAVMRAVEQAQRYVRVLRDNPDAGFEGYQAAPGTDEAQLSEVDRQVQAIWATLVHEWQLGYINPPPGYSKDLDSQRLRTPSMVLDGHAGTCIDLALLFAACLELIDIYPVVFLLNGHALPGYWRHQSFQTAYSQAKLDNQGPTPAVTQDRNASSEAQVYAWQDIGPDAYKEIAGLIRTRRLVPVETVRLTEHCGFVEAIESGVQALGEVRDFHSVLDIATARIKRITPLPIAAEPPWGAP